MKERSNVMDESGKPKPSERRLVGKPEFYGKLFDKLKEPCAVLDLAALKRLVGKPEFYCKLFDKLKEPCAVLDLAAVKKCVFISPNVPEDVQVTGTDNIADETSVGFNEWLYKRLGLLFLSSFLENHRQPLLDYKCYSFCQIITGDYLEPLESAVKEWVKTCMNEWFNGFLATDETVFRRSTIERLACVRPSIQKD